MVNAVTNKIYVANGNSGSVTVVDGASNRTITVAVGDYPIAIAVNAVTNKIYVATCGTDPTCSSNGAITVIDGATLNTQNVTVGVQPNAVAVNATTNKIYVSNLGCNSPPCKRPCRSGPCSGRWTAS